MAASYNAVDSDLARLLAENNNAPPGLFSQFSSLTLESKGAIARDHVCLFVPLTTAFLSFVY